MVVSLLDFLGDGGGGSFGLFLFTTVSLEVYMSEIQTRPLTFQEQIILQQLQKHHNQTLNDFDKLDAKAQSVVSVSSVIITIISGFQLASSATFDGGRLLIILALYLATFGCALWALLPKELYYEPIKTDWDHVRDALRLDEDDFYFRLLSGYELAFYRNREVNIRKANLVYVSYILLGITVLITLLLALFK